MPHTQAYWTREVRGERWEEGRGGVGRGGEETGGRGEGRRRGEGKRCYNCMLLRSVQCPSLLGGGGDEVTWEKGELS